MNDTVDAEIEFVGNIFDSFVYPSNFIILRKCDTILSVQDNLNVYIKTPWGNDGSRKMKITLV